MAMLGFSAGPKHYLATTPNNLLYGRATAAISVHERRLFMGFLVMGLVVIGAWPPISRTRIAYLVALVMTIDISFAHRGLLLGWLYDHLTIYQGLRVPSRIGQLTLLCAAVLSGFGVARVAAALRERRPRGVAIPPRPPRQERERRMSDGMGRRRFMSMSAGTLIATDRH